MELSLAQDIGQRLVEAIKPAVSRVEVAGSVRRKKANVKDVELCCVVTDYERLFEELKKHGRFIKPGVPDVIDWPPTVGAKYLRMMLKEDVKCDVFIATPVNWGGIFCMRTGSAVGEDGNVWSGFIPQLYRKFKKVSDGGMMTGGQPTLPDGTVLPVPEEIDVFNLCKVHWVEPELRNNCKSIKSL